MTLVQTRKEYLERTEGPGPGEEGGAEARLWGADSDESPIRHLHFTLLFQNILTSVILLYPYQLGS